MLRRSLIRLSSTSTKKGRRTVVRDPRKKKAALASAQVQRWEDKPTDDQLQTHSTPPPLPPAFAPSESNQAGVGSTLGSYMLAGVGVTMGFTLVKVVFGI
jgi:hypothetical protein